MPLSFCPTSERLRGEFFLSAQEENSFSTQFNRRYCLSLSALLTDWLVHENCWLPVVLTVGSDLMNWPSRSSRVSCCVNFYFSPENVASHTHRLGAFKSVY